MYAQVIGIVLCLIALIGLVAGVRGDVRGTSAFWSIFGGALCFLLGFALSPDMLTLAELKGPWKNIQSLIAYTMMVWGVLSTPYWAAALIGWAGRSAVLSFCPTEKEVPFQSR